MPGAARVAHVTLRAADVLVPLKDPTTGKRREVKVSAINAREMVSCPTGEEPLDWLLLTNLRVENFAQAREVVSTYALRWRIEQFHLEFSEIELHALLLFKRRSKKKTETIPDSVPTIAQATLWLAELGGYTGKSSGGPPGTITISRGLAKLRSAADAIAAFLAADDEENG